MHACMHVDGWMDRTDGLFRMFWMLAVYGCNTHTHILRYKLNP